MWDFKNEIFAKYEIMKCDFENVIFVKKWYFENVKCDICEKLAAKMWYFFLKSDFENVNFLNHVILNKLIFG